MKGSVFQGFLSLEFPLGSSWQQSWVPPLPGAAELQEWGPGEHVCTMRPDEGVCVGTRVFISNKVRILLLRTSLLTVCLVETPVLNGNSPWCRRAPSLGFQSPHFVTYLHCDFVTLCFSCKPPEAFSGFCNRKQTQVIVEPSFNNVHCGCQGYSPGWSRPWSGCCPVPPPET